MTECSTLSKVIYENLNKKFIKNLDFCLKCKSDNFGFLLIIRCQITSETVIYLRVNTLYHSTSISVTIELSGRPTILLEDYYANESTCMDAARILNDNFSKRLS